MTYLFLFFKKEDFFTACFLVKILTTEKLEVEPNFLIPETCALPSFRNLFLPTFPLFNTLNITMSNLLFNNYINISKMMRYSQ